MAMVSPFFPGEYTAFWTPGDLLSIIQPMKNLDGDAGRIES
jgi:hypothetical protein